ncbi:MAG TPA: cellulase family glycosylhydrolase [Cryptosporangiaceae bacterium]|nr:cellulase family glycosylhydrolase [Cryptosporangiaceae bacterium]
MERRQVIKGALFAVPVAAAGVAIGAATQIGSPQRSGSDLTDPFPGPGNPELGVEDLPPTLGVNFHGTWEMYWPQGADVPNAMFTRHLDQLHEQGVAVLRVDHGWSTSQPTEAAPSADRRYNRRLGYLLDQAKARKMKVLVTVHQSPEWARPGTGGEPKQFPSDPDAIRPWASWLAETYGDRVLGWEVWNEPNLVAFTGVADPSERPVRYVPLLRAFSEAVKKVKPDSVVVFGGPSKNDDKFIKACYEVGARNYFDVLSVHPYQGDQTVPPEAEDLAGPGRMTHFGAIVELMARYDDIGKPVWWTEFGFSVHSNDGVPADQPWNKGVATDAISADYLRRSFELARRRYPQVRLAVVYAAYRPPGGAYGHVHGFRMLDEDGTLRPQLPTLRGWISAYGATRPLLAPLPTASPPTPTGSTSASGSPRPVR